MEMGKQYCICLLREEQRKDELDISEPKELREIEKRYSRYVEELVRYSHCPKMDIEPCESCLYAKRR